MFRLEFYNNGLGCFTMPVWFHASTEEEARAQYKLACDNYPEKCWTLSHDGKTIAVHNSQPV